MSAPPKATVDLKGVPETLLMTLYNRSVESQRGDPILRDEKAERLIERIDYDFTRFGEGRITHPIRATVFDGWVGDFLVHHPNATVVNLGVGLSTQSERIDNGRARFVDLDLPEVIAVRRRFFEDTDRHRMIAASALDEAWMDAIDPERPAFFVAAGLLMFFEPDDVRTLLGTLVERFPGAEMAFDVIPTRFSQRSLDGKAQIADFTLPPMPWGIDYHRVSELETWHPRLSVVDKRDYTQGFRRRWGLIGWLALIPPLRNLFMGTLIHVRFRAPDGQRRDRGVSLRADGLVRHDHS
ncbi:MAG: class I SAM-dependent methyltransferase [Bacteroidetes bacterium]|nr:class I SAM-dependent methyltransferase [Bacteroidota bacterium]